MRIRAWVFGLLALSAIAFVACGSDDSDGGGGGGGSNKQMGCYGTTGQTCTGTAAYETCITSACNAEYVACYGASYKSGSFSGPCADLVGCQMACPCDAKYSNCVQACMPKMTTDCQSCSVTLATCMQGAACTQPVCTSTGAGGSSGAGGSAGSSGSTIESCADLAACCAKITTADVKSSCDQIAAAAVEQSCAATGATFATFCP